MHRAHPLVLAGRSPLTLRVGHALEEQCHCALPSPLLLAVSGGADSCALLLLIAALWKRKRALDQLAVICVDHGIRRESSQETREVEALAHSLGVNRVLVTRVEVARIGNLEAAARVARWKAVASAMDRLAIDQVATGHHADDLFESFLFQLMRKRGNDALSTLASRAPIPARVPKQRVVIRPLRGIRKRDLVAFLTKCGIAWSEDPTNLSPDQFRAQVRLFLRQGGALLDPCVDGLASLCIPRVQEGALARTRGKTSSSSRESLRVLTQNGLRGAVVQLLHQAGCGAPQHTTLSRLLRAIGDDQTRPRTFAFRGATLTLTRQSLHAETIA